MSNKETKREIREFIENAINESKDPKIVQKTNIRKKRKEKKQFVKNNYGL